MMDWTRSETLALAMHQCAQCHGSGLRLARKGLLSPCNCVLRSIFRICYARFQKCVTQERHLSRVSMEPHAGRNRPESWGRKDEEYIADFTLVAKRTLTAEEHRLFRFHFLLGADWKLCARQLKIDRGNFFHAVYRIEQKLGRVFRELEPYPLFPLDDYFHGPSRLAPEVVQMQNGPRIVKKTMGALAKDSRPMAPLWAGPLRFPPVGRTA
jgi:hypothetical protein